MIAANVGIANTLEIILLTILISFSDNQCIIVELLFELRTYVCMIFICNIGPVMGKCYLILHTWTNHVSVSMLIICIVHV